MLTNQIAELKPRVAALLEAPPHLRTHCLVGHFITVIITVI
jgi:hypothetical protein